MKTKEKFYMLSIRMTESERESFRRLKDEHGINISGTVKIFLREKLEQLDKLKNK